tara:strand:- start:99 stop:800 length:702 start_codon:yes stop_codon:yes gene_type:complete
MNNRGQLGQIITSFPALIIIFVIMTIFFLVSAFISSVGAGNESDESDYNSQIINSRVLLEMFLGDYVLINETKIKVEDAFLEFILANDEIYRKKSKLPNSLTKIKNQKSITLIQERFEEKYGCNKTNQLQIYAKKLMTHRQAGDYWGHFLYASFPLRIEDLPNNLEDKSYYLEIHKRNKPLSETILFMPNSFRKVWNLNKKYEGLKIVEEKMMEQKEGEEIGWQIVIKGNVKC